MKIDDVDEAIIRAFREDGRQSNREVARQLELSEGTIRQRLKKLQRAGAVRFDVVSDAAQMGIRYIAYVRVSVAPRHLEHFLVNTSAMAEVFYVAATVGRFNVLALIVTEEASRALAIINDQIESLPGVHEVEVRQVADQVKYDFHEIVIPKVHGADRGQ